MKYRLIGQDEASLANIFRNRGLKSTDILGVTEKALHNPFLMKNMEKAVDKVKEHLDKESLIVIQQDPDADGYTSTALFYQYIKRVAPDASLVVLIHEGKAHGIDLKSVMNLIEDETVMANYNSVLVVSPDASSNEHDVHKKLFDLGIDVVILDHHEAESYSPYAVMVNPSLDDYPNKNISGVGVTQKFAKGFDIKYGYDYAEDYYDLVAVGMIADMIEITTPETIFMVQKGMSNVNNEFLKALYQKQAYSMKGAVTPTGISFYISPMINAVTRTATLEEKLMVCKALCNQTKVEVPSTKRGKKEGDTEDMHEQTVRIMANIKSRQGREVDKAINIVESIIEEQELDKNQLIVIDAQHQFSKDFNGLIANKIMAEKQKPVLLGNSTNGILGGSGRTYDKSDLPDLRGFLNESGIVNFAEGHAAAHGFGVNVDRVPELVNYANEKLAGLDFTPNYRVDFTMQYSKIDLAFLEQLTQLSPYWARGIEEPFFLIKDVPVSCKEVEISGDFDSNTLKITKSGFTAMKFRLPDDKVQAFVDNEQVVMDLIGRVSINEYRGKKSLTIFMEDFEVKRTQTFYF